MNTSTEQEPLILKVTPRWRNGCGMPQAQLEGATLTVDHDEGRVTAHASMPYPAQGGSNASLWVAWERGTWESWEGLNSLPSERAEWLPKLRQLVERVLSETPEGQALLTAHSRRSEGTACFVRFGKLPEAGRSWNHRDNHYEAGVSVYPARKTKAGYWIDLAGIDAVSAMFIQTAGELYEVNGTPIGTGSDGEPVLADCTARRARKPLLGMF